MHELETGKDFYVKINLIHAPFDLREGFYDHGYKTLQIR